MENSESVNPQDVGRRLGKQGNINMLVDEIVKPNCIWCGGKLELAGRYSLICLQPLCPISNHAFTEGSWENTYAHRRIAALERRNAELEKENKILYERKSNDRTAYETILRLRVEKRDLERQLKDAEKVIEERGYAFQEAQQKTLVRNQELERQLKEVKENNKNV